MSESHAIYALVDCARDRRLHAAISRSACRHTCLIDVHEDDEITTVAPYLVQLYPDRLLYRALFEEGAAKHWCIFFTSHYDYEILLEHCREILYARAQDRKKMFFRYYDPRVLRKLLPVCDDKELTQIFGPITAFWLHDPEDACLHHYFLKDKMLCINKQSLLSHDNELTEPV
ncbi:MAG: DUF4123 domain-containing protein [Gammaproteobacteria bacterium]|nr:DUF4123 domain-containing protein [Gammaproteobacteria bacterium]MDH5728619.1 DUF4123 domain-containing protein [Gammaproteobacteria bacterium]